MLILLNDALSRKDQMVQIERTQTRYLEDLNHGLQLFYDSTGKLFEYQMTHDPAARRHSIDSLHALESLYENATRRCCDGNDQAEL